MRFGCCLAAVVWTSCASTGPAKIAFSEVFPPSPEVPIAAPELPVRRVVKLTAGETLLATPSLELQSQLVRLGSEGRKSRAATRKGAPMPDGQAQNWESTLGTVDTFLERKAQETSSYDVIRARATLEAELELDARTYGTFSPELAERIVERITKLGVRMAEVRSLGVKTKVARVNFVWPIEPVSVTSLFGKRLHPISRTYKLHFGVDLAAADGQRVTAAATGSVIRAGWNGAHGQQVEIQHPGGVVTRYSHLSQVLVDPGTVVRQGDVVGLAGSTGHSTGTHLHFELWRAGNACDPLEELGQPNPMMDSVASR